MSTHPRPQLNRRRKLPSALTTTEILQALPVPLLWQEEPAGTLYANAAYRERWAALPDPEQLSQPEGTLLTLRTPAGQDRYARLQVHPAPALLRGLHHCWTTDDVHDFLVDPLTGLPTRQAWELLSAAGTRGAAQDGAGADATLELTLLDLNGFKIVNDTYGHAAGDATLRLMGRLLTRLGARGTMQAYRLGGDEFLLVRRGGRPLDVPRLHRDFQQAAQRELGLSGLSFAAGQVTAPADGRPPQALLPVADARMYRAKHAARTSASARPEASTPAGALSGSRRVLRRLQVPVRPWPLGAWILRPWPPLRWPLRLWPVRSGTPHGAWFL